MGGAAFLGIRHLDGTLHYSEVWTNTLPWLLTTRSFLEEGEAMREFRSSCKFTNTWPQPRKLRNRVIYSEYGVILVDCKEKMIFSRNDYCTPGKIPIGLDLVQGDNDEIENYLAQKWPYQFVTVNWKKGEGLIYTPFTPEEQAQTLERLQTGKPNLDLPKGNVFELHLDLEPWKVDHKVSRPSRHRDTAKEIQTFLREKNWG